MLTTNQLRLVLRIAAAHGEEIDAQRAPEIGATIANGLAFRALAHQAVGLIPVAGWALQGAFAYTGTRAIGEAAIRWFGSRSEPGEAASIVLGRPRRFPRPPPLVHSADGRRPATPSGAGPTITRIDLGGSAMVGAEHAEELLQIEEADAWFEYLEATRGQSETRYCELEPWAWARLSQRLRAVRARRARLRPAAA